MHDSTAASASNGLIWHTERQFMEETAHTFHLGINAAKPAILYCCKAVLEA